MKSLYRISIRIVSPIAALVILLTLAPPNKAQTGNRGNPGQPAPTGPPPSSAPPAASIRERQFKMDEMEREAAKPRAPEEERLALAQIAEDFRRIQVINNRMMSAAMFTPTPDYGNIADTTA